MVVVDTCGWVEWLEGSPLMVHYDSVLLNVADLIVPTAVQLELYKWTCRERSLEHAIGIVNYSATATVVPLNQDIAIEAADVCVAHGLSFADGVIYATALHYQATLITSDAHFKGLPHVEYVVKSSKKPQVKI